MGMLKEFREFAVKGNVIDLAVGLIIGGAFGKIVTSLVNDIIMPPIGMLLSGVDFKEGFKTVLKEGDKAAKIPEVAINWGQFASTILDFVIIAFCIFIVIRQINRLKRQPPPAAPTEKDCPYCLARIPIKATKCGHCTSNLPGEPAGVAPESLG